MTSLTAANDLAIRRALEAAGVEFIAENGGGSGTPKVCSLEIISLDCTPVKGRATKQPDRLCWRICGEAGARGILRLPETKRCVPK
jgi:hypothetical protein